MVVFDSSGKEIKLKQCIGRGGEGSVYSTDSPNLAVKLYHKPPDGKKTEKILAMIKAKNEKLLNVSAWPVDTVHSQPGGPAAGILMPRVMGFREIHMLYNPKSRIIEFPSAGWDFLVHAASNIARLFSVIHSQGHVIGDVNHGNITVSNKGTVMLIDCDSIQVNADGIIYPCDVGVGIYQPPEIHDAKSYSEIIRTGNHDNFGLAVLIFQFLFMGRHPFSERYSGDDDMPLERAIIEKRFPYARSSQLEKPEAALDLGDLTGPLASFFEAAFLTEKRPTAEQWVRELDNLLRQLTQCPVSSAHRFYNKLNECPWCRIERKTGAVLFSAAAGFRGSKADIDEIIKKINSFEIPGSIQLSDIRSIDVGPSRVYSEYRIKKRIFRALAAFSLVCGILGFVIPNVIALGIFGVLGSFAAAFAGFKHAPASVVQKTQERYDTALEKLNSCTRLMKSGEIEKQYQDKKSELEMLYNSYISLRTSRENKLKDLRQNRKKYQLERFLSRHYIIDAGIKDIPPGFKAVLQSYGIRTAADIGSKIKGVPGIRPVVIENLVKWRKAVESKFNFDSSGSIDREIIEKIDKVFMDEKEKIADALKKGLESLETSYGDVVQKRKEVILEIERCSRELVRARENLKAIGCKV